MKLQAYYNSNLVGMECNQLGHHFLYYLNKFLQGIKIQFHIEFLEDSKTLMGNLGKLRCHSDHNIFLQDIKDNLSGLRLADSIQDRKDIEL